MQACGSALTYSEHDRVPEWWREFKPLLSFKDEHASATSISKGCPTVKQATSIRLPAAHNAERQTCGLPHPAWLYWGDRRLPSPEGLQGNSWLSSGAGMKKLLVLAMALQHLCHPCWNAPRGALWSCARTPWDASCPWLRVVINLSLRCWRWWGGTPWAPPTWRGTFIAESQHEQRNWPVVYFHPSEQTTHSRAWGSCTTRGVLPLCQEKDHQHPLGLPFHGPDKSMPPSSREKQTGPCKHAPCRSQLGLTCLRVSGSGPYPMLSSDRVRCWYQCQSQTVAQVILGPDVPTTDPAWIPSDQPDSSLWIEELWANMQCSL